MNFDFVKDRNLLSFCNLHGFVRLWLDGTGRIFHKPWADAPGVLLEIRGRTFSKFYGHHVYDVQVLRHPNASLARREVECTLQDLHNLLTQKNPIMIKDGWADIVFQGPATLGDLPIKICIS